MALPPIDIYADTSDLAWIRANAGRELIKGFTTNPSLMRKAGVTDYERFGREVLEAAQGKPVSLEVISDDTGEMIAQALKIASWGTNAYVKIPCVHANGEIATDVIKPLAKEGIQLNITAALHMRSFLHILPSLSLARNPIQSVFAGRIADTMRDPVVRVNEFRHTAPNNLRILWASCREIFNVKQAVAAGADIITLFPSMIEKLSLQGKNLEEYQRETVVGFLADAKQAGYQL